MTEPPGQGRVVIIDGGVVGVSALYHRARAGWADCVVLEKNELTAGSIWHAAGNVPTFSISCSIMNMQRYPTELNQGLGAEVDYPMDYHVTGSKRLGSSNQHMQEFAQSRGMGQSQGMALDILSTDEIRGQHPFIEHHDLKGALNDPADGDTDPAQLTQALAKGARTLGATIVRFCPAIWVSREQGEWIVHTVQGHIRCKIVVKSAGQYAQPVRECFKPFGGRTVPMMVMSHQYMVFDEVKTLRDWSTGVGHKLALLRDVDTSYYLRQETAGFNPVPYERDCRAHWADPSDPMAENFSFELYPDDLECLFFQIEDAMARVPMLAEAGLAKVINGPIPYAPDGNPLIGPMPGVPNAFEACVFTFGIDQGGGAGKVLAEWVTEGQTEWDTWSCDPRRFTNYTDPANCAAKGKEVHGHEYAMHLPRHRWPAAPDLKFSLVHERMKGMGGQMGAYAGWERANWFASPGDDPSQEATRTWDRAGTWEPRIHAECEAGRDGVGVHDLLDFARFHLSGPGANDWPLGKIAGGLPKPGPLSMAYFPDARGRIVTKLSVGCGDTDDFTLITAATAQWHDYEWLVRDLVPGLTLTDRTCDLSTLIVTGPRSRGLLEAIGTEADLTLHRLRPPSAVVAGQGCTLLRVSFADELGREIHAANEAIPALYEAVLDAGATPFGMFALDSLRIEKGYRAWRGDLSTDCSLLEGGLDRFIRLDKPQDFTSKAALLARQYRGVKKRFVNLILDGGTADAPDMSTLWRGGDEVGEVTSNAWGYRVAAFVALDMLRADQTRPGTEVEIDVYGTRPRATVQPDGPLWDPDKYAVEGLSLERVSPADAGAEHRGRRRDPPGRRSLGATRRLRERRRPVGRDLQDRNRRAQDRGLKPERVRK